MSSASHYIYYFYLLGFAICFHCTITCISKLFRQLCNSSLSYVCVNNIQLQRCVNCIELARHLRCPWASLWLHSEHAMATEASSDCSWRCGWSPPRFYNLRSWSQPSRLMLVMAGHCTTDMIPRLYFILCIKSPSLVSLYGVSGQA